MSQTWFIKLPSIETKLQITEASHKVAVNSFKIMAILNFYFGPRKNQSMHKKTKVSVKDFWSKFEKIAENCGFVHIYWRNVWQKNSFFNQWFLSRKRFLKNETRLREKVESTGQNLIWEKKHNSTSKTMKKVYTVPPSVLFSCPKWKKILTKTFKIKRIYIFNKRNEATQESSNINFT